jgi:hypothetical protein
LFHRPRESACVVAATVAVEVVIAAGLTLQAVLTPGSGRGHPRSVESAVTDLDDAIRQLRQAISGLESRIDHHGLRHQVQAQCTDLSPVPEITFAGPVDDALLPAAREQLLDQMRESLATSGTTSGLAFVAVEAGEQLRVTVTVTATEEEPPAEGGRDLGPVRGQALLAGEHAF